MSPIKTYLREISKLYAGGEATEHSYRPALQRLLEQVATDFTIINEPKRKKYGMPDFVVEKSGVPIGHVECKDIGANLDNVIKEEQLVRYLNALPNLLLTDYISFRWYHNGELRIEAHLARHADDKLKEEKTGVANLQELLAEFLNAEVLAVGTAAELAERMAAKARLLRESIMQVLQAPEEDHGNLSMLLNNYREVLNPRLTAPEFADMQAQTATYGLFAACYHHRERQGEGAFTREKAAFIATNPFLRDVFLRIAGPGMDERLAWIADDLAVLLDRVDMTAILEDFGGDEYEKDPVVHFYEDFLKAYDRKLRQKRGVFYTPAPIVSWIVRSVDYLLRNRFDIADGLANYDTVSFRRKPNTEVEEQPRVLILDPAVGTGTFLCEVINLVYRTVRGKGREPVWPDYVHKHLLPRLFGFEIMMAPYAICHLKLEAKLAETNADIANAAKECRLHIYLTNTLGKAEESTSGPMFAHEIAREANEAYTVKQEKPVMVVLGNPPYFGNSANKGQWIKNLLHGNDDGQETADYFSVDGAPLNERNSKWLNDDYVKFIRFAHWRIEKTGEGVLGFITNHAWIYNPTFCGMRESLLCDFDEIYILDLHGNSKSQEKDGNIFEIPLGAAISLFIKQRDGNRTSPARIFHADLWGKKKEKFAWLENNDINTTEWKELSPTTPHYLFTPRDESLAEEYEKGWKITNIFPVNSTGIFTAQDKITIHWTAEEVESTVTEFVSLSEEDARERFNLPRDTENWKISSAQEDLRTHPDMKKQVVPILYRPFDWRFTWYSGKSGGFICRPRVVMRHMLMGENIGLSIGRAGQVVSPEEWDVVHVSDSLTDLNLFRRGGNCLFPLYLYSESSEQQGGLYKTECKPNITLEFIEIMKKKLGKNYKPETILHYIYAVLYSSEYRSRYRDFLKTDFPRIPIPDDATLFRKLAAQGKTLVHLHLMQDIGLDKDRPVFTTGNGKVEKIHHSDNKVSINKQQYFAPVNEEIWTYSIGGYKPAQKWLKDRKGKTLDYEDVEHYQNICAVLAKTSRAMKRIGAIVAEYGGWSKIGSGKE